MKRIQGTAASRGVAIGQIRFFNYVAKRSTSKSGRDPIRERERFEHARKESIEMLEKLYAHAKKEIGGDYAMIFQSQQALLQDVDYLDAVYRLLDTQGCSAEYAVQAAEDYFLELFSRVEDAYIKERGADVRDISNRLVRLLRGEKEPDSSDFGGQFIVAADVFMPSETVRMKRDEVLAIVARNGSQVSHAAILARSMGIPAIVSVGRDYDALHMDGIAIVDGFSGEIILDPDERTLVEYRGKLQEYENYQERLKSYRDKPSRTADATPIQVCGNISKVSDVKNVLENGGDGIGLFRSEALFLESRSAPEEETQFLAYKSVLEQMGERRVVVRTLDLGADKMPPYLTLAREENPAMGCRAIRLCLQRPQLFRTQLRALLRASVYGNLAIMLPMIISLSEVRQAKSMLEACRSELEGEGIPVREKIEFGVMIETPAAAMISGELAREVDFFSIGTNDLTQYTLAVDRMNGNIGTIYDPRHPAVLRLCWETVRQALENGIWVGVCGEAAANRDMAMLFLAMGVTELSVTPASILEIREQAAQLNLISDRERILDFYHICPAENQKNPLKPEEKKEKAH